MARRPSSGGLPLPEPIAAVPYQPQNMFFQQGSGKACFGPPTFHQRAGAQPGGGAAQHAGELARGGGHGRGYARVREYVVNVNAADLHACAQHSSLF